MEIQAKTGCGKHYGHKRKEDIRKEQQQKTPEIVAIHVSEQDPMGPSWDTPVLHILSCSSYPKYLDNNI